MDKQSSYCRTPFLSIIVPVYNSEKYLSTCLDSLLGQDVEATAYEIICINDGSTDTSLTILHQYAAEYGNIRVVDKTNGGVSAARNLGLSLAKGQYVWFIDADDWIARNCLGLIKEQIEQYAPSVIQVVLDYITAEWRVSQCAAIQLNKDNVFWSVHKDRTLSYNGIGASIINRELLIRYNHKFLGYLYYGEDVLFMEEVFDRIRIETERQEFEHYSVQWKNEIVYYYRQHDKSAMHTSWTKHRQRYADSLLSLAKIHRSKMLDSSKPEWYVEKYAKLYGQRMQNYMLHWLPGLQLDIFKHMKKLKDEKLYPIPKSVLNRMYGEEKASNGCVAKLKEKYQYLVLRWGWLYPLYYLHINRKYRDS